MQRYSYRPYWFGKFLFLSKEHEEVLFLLEDEEAYVKLRGFKLRADSWVTFKRVARFGRMFI